MSGFRSTKNRGAFFEKLRAGKLNPKVPGVATPHIQTPIPPNPMKSPESVDPLQDAGQKPVRFKKLKRLF